MKAVAETIERVADTGVDVLILGETGTGKELVARSVHNLGRRADGPFVPVDCGAIPENLLESEFFGYERGAFTGADRQRRGLLETASGGTFFLDEIGDLPLVLQAKLLRVLQERKLRRVGGNDEVQERTFREDLYYRINVVRIDLPPLRERGDDLGLLAEHFTLRCSREMERRVPAITPAAYSLMRRYHWPGNIRELQNVIRRAIVLSDDDKISTDNLPVSLVAAAGSANGSLSRSFFEIRDEYLSRFARESFDSLLRRPSGNVKESAREAQLPRGTLYRLLKSHAVDPAEFRH